LDMELDFEVDHDDFEDDDDEFEDEVAEKRGVLARHSAS